MTNLLRSIFTRAYLRRNHEEQSPGATGRILMPGWQLVIVARLADDIPRGEGAADGDGWGRVLWKNEFQEWIKKQIMLFWLSLYSLAKLNYCACYNLITSIFKFMKTIKENIGERDSKKHKKMKEKQVVSNERVMDHGEVYTNEREVNAMLDLVKQETEHIESRFLEPACGTGNFLTEILRRKLQVVHSRYQKSQFSMNATRCWRFPTSWH